LQIAAKSGATSGGGGGRGLPASPQRPTDKRQKMSFVLTVAAFPRVPRVPRAITVCCKRQKMSFVPTASVFIAVHPRSKCYNCVMQPQTVYIMSKAAINLAEGTGSAKAVFYLSNHRGDTLAAYRDSSTLVARYRYDAFGNQRTTYCMVDESENAPRYTFSTKEFLSDAKLYLYAYRVYDPAAGRWTQRDPIDYEDSMNLYQFCANNSVCRIDNDGRLSDGVLTVTVGPIVYTVYIAVNLKKAIAGVEAADEYNTKDNTVYALTIRLSPLTLYTRDYYMLSPVGRHIIDKHEFLHKLGAGEEAAYQDSIDRCTQILKDGKWNGAKLSKDQKKELSKLLRDSIRALKNEERRRRQRNSVD
jgi:RHS repeat-associated protein